jgi:hypothetical protein
LNITIENRGINRSKNGIEEGAAVQQFFCCIHNRGGRFYDEEVACIVQVGTNQIDIIFLDEVMGQFFLLLSIKTANGEQV